MKKVFNLILALLVSGYTLVSCSGTDVEMSDYEFVDSVLTYKDEPVAVITKVKKGTKEMELTSGNVTFTEERPVLRVSLRLLKKTNGKVNYTSLSIYGIDQDDSKVKNASWSCHDYTQEQKLGEFLNKEVGDTITIKLTNRKREKDVDYHMDQIAKLKVDYFIPHVTEGAKVTENEPASAGHPSAVINDPDGFTNVREGQNGQSKIVGKIYNGDVFYYEKTSSDWWEVYLKDDNNMMGYMHKSRIKDVDSSDDYSSSGGGDWDEILDAYEKCVNRIVSVSKKTKAGDMSAMSEYTELAEEYQELADKCQGAKSNMTAAQLERYQKITNKYVKGIQ